MTEKIFEKKVMVDRYEQKLSFYCGAACSKMMLGKYGVHVNQREAYEKIHSRERFKTEKMYSDPDGISDYLNHMTPDSIDFVVDDYSTDSPIKIMQRIFYTISFLNMPVITLVDSGNHWVVIDGVRYTETTDGKREILGLYIKNPWFKTISPIYQSAKELIENKLRPNKWGKKWLSKLVIISDQRQPLLMDIPLRTPVLPIAGGGGSEVVALSAMEQQGFVDVTPISGGGAAIYSDIQVKDINGTHVYTISILDAIRTAEWKDFVYLAYDLSGSLLEIASFASVLEIPDDNETRLMANIRFNGMQLSIDPNYYYIESYFTTSRFDVYRKITVGGESYYMHRNMEFYTKPNDYNPVAGG